MSDPTRLIIQTGAFANDGTGDTLREAGNKINDNFTSLWDGVYGATAFDSGTVDDLIDSYFASLPTTDPSSLGSLWRDSANDNVLKVSRG